MPVFTVWVSWTMAAGIEIEAEDADAAEEAAYEYCDLPKGEYVSDSFRVDEVVRKRE
mgnify:CR=1 FL=1